MQKKTKLNMILNNSDLKQDLQLERKGSLVKNKSLNDTKKSVKFVDDAEKQLIKLSSLPRPTPDEIYQKA